ncbi:MAG: NifU family protein, partial [Myxococcales bacterium]|nr:NifU family protein [Myxococcales bacterium]
MGASAHDDVRTLAPDEASSGALVARLETVFAAVDTLDPSVRAKVLDLLGALLEMYGEGLARIVAALQDDDAGGARTVLDDEVVASLLLIHDLHPVPLRDRVESALARARPYVESHGGELALIELDGREGVARIRLGGTCRTCPSSQATLDGLLRDALAADAPDLARIELVEPRDDGQAKSDLLGIVESGAVSARARWVGLDGVDALRPGEGVRVEEEGRALFVARLDDDLLAYENACAACGAPLDDGDVHGEVLACGRGRERFDLRRAGRSLAPGG